MIIWCGAQVVNENMDVDGGNDSGRGHSLCARVSKCCLVVLGPYWDNVLNQNLDPLGSDSDEVSLLPIPQDPELALLG